MFTGVINIVLRDYTHLPLLVTLVSLPINVHDNTTGTTLVNVRPDPEIRTDECVEYLERPVPAFIDLFKAWMAARAFTRLVRRHVVV